jgi:phenylacetate-CoA ligase
MWSARSSGTSGEPITVYRTPGSSIFELCSLERQWSWFGLRTDSRRVVLRGSTFVAENGGQPTKLINGGNLLLVSSFHLTEDNTSDIVDEIRAFRPHAIEGWPSSMTLLAGLLRERQTRLPMHAVITSSEVMSQSQQALLRDAFVGPIIDHYGQTERVAQGGTCERGTFHLFPDYGIVELLPVPGAPHRREIVGTPLHNYGFPIFRYRTGDQVSLATTDACPCRRAFPVIGPVDGRVEDIFSTSNGRPLPQPAIVLDNLAGVLEAQIAQLAPGRFEVRVVPGGGFDEQRTSDQLHRNVDLIFGKGQELTIRTVTELPRQGNGKLRTTLIEG